MSNIQVNTRDKQMNDIQTIDVHSHMILPCYKEGLQKMGIVTKRKGDFPEPDWSEDAHLEFMDHAGISCSILSLSSPHIHGGDGRLACETARAINEEVYDICKRHPGRLKFAATLPFPEVDGSIKEINRCYDELGAAAVKLPSSANGIYLGDSSQEPVFEELNRRKAVVLIHPDRPKDMPENVFTAGPAPLFEFIADTTRAVLNMIARGTLERYPDIKVVVPHCGSFLPFVAHRMIGISRIMIPQGLMPPVDVRKAMSRLYFDVAGDALPVALDALLKIADPSHILYGSDYPYTPAPMILANREKFEKYEPIQGELNAIFRENAEKLFGGLID